jgi:hypothetical protein
MRMIKEFNDVFKHMTEILNTLIEWWLFVLFNYPRYK